MRQRFQVTNAVSGAEDWDGCEERATIFTFNNDKEKRYDLTLEEAKGGVRTDMASDG